MPPKKKVKREPKTLPVLPAAESPELTEAYGMRIPQEVVDIYNVAKKKQPDAPLLAFSEVIGVRLVGPFELLDKKITPADGDPNMHWRFWYDPPEVMTVLVENITRPSRHWGYHRDDPKDMPSMVVCATHNSYEFTIVGNCLLGALSSLCSQKNTPEAAKLRDELEEVLMTRGYSWVNAKTTAAMRNEISLAKTFSKLGLVVPYNKETELGYREMHHTLPELKKLLEAVAAGKTSEKQREELAEVSQFVDIGNDECDFGHGLEVGLNYFCFAKSGSSLHDECTRMLSLAYMLLDRKVFQATIEAHMANRAKKIPVGRIDFKKTGKS